MKNIIDKKAKGTYRPDREIPEGEVSDFIDGLPVPPSYWKLSPRVKKIYREIGNQLVQEKMLKSFDKYALIMLATAVDEYITMSEIIQDKEAVKRGSGMIQTFKNGTSNVSTEFTVRERAFKTILQVSGKFGMTVRDRLSMNLKKAESGQLNLFDQMNDMLKVI
jgi:P27 family predicted phage terminase small subunit